MSWLVPVVLMLATSCLFGAAIFADHAGDRPRLATVLALAGLVVFTVMMVTLPEVQWPVTPPPAPAYDPIECADLAWLDGKWTCIPFDLQG